MADLIWAVNYGGKTYEFNAHKDLTVGNLRHIKQWYGPELGRWSPFILALGQGDPDAWACAIWIVRRKAGETNVPEPNMMPDFAIGEMMKDGVQLSRDEPEEPENPTSEEEDQTQGSTEIPTSSGAGTSST
jgi:hypothetical protein